MLFVDCTTRIAIGRAIVRQSYRSPQAVNNARSIKYNFARFFKYVNFFVRGPLVTSQRNTSRREPLDQTTYTGPDTIRVISMEDVSFGVCYLNFSVLLNGIPLKLFNAHPREKKLSGSVLLKTKKKIESTRALWSPPRCRKKNH